MVCDLFSPIHFCSSLSNVVVIGSLSATTVALGLFLYLSNHQMSDLSSPGTTGPGQVIAANRSLRIAIFLISTALIAACAIFSVVSSKLFDGMELRIHCAIQLT